MTAKRIKHIMGPGLVVILFGTLLVQLPIAIAARASTYEWFDPIIDVRRILVDRFVDPPDEERMQRAMIEAMIDVLEDPYTLYIPPASTDDFNKELRGVYAGIGAEVNMMDEQIVIVSPMDDSPSLRAGVEAGDVILEIEGTSTFQLSMNDCIERLTGEIGTPVHIRVRHLDGTEEDIEIIREQIVARTVRGLRRDGETWNHCIDSNLGLAYVRVTQFNADTVDELRMMLDELVKTGLGGLVLDLRDNPGGGLPAAVGMADLFLTGGVIVSVRPRVGEEVVYEARSGGTLPDFPMIVLVNEASASASEIVAGALQENGRAHVLGERTFGKGSVQEVRRLEYGAGTLKYTAAHYYLPSGRNLNRNPDAEIWGVDPDMGLVVPLDDEAYLANLQARREHEAIRRENGIEPCVDTEWIETTLLDPQLASAIRTLGAAVRREGWPAVTDLDPADVAHNQELVRARRARGHLLEQLGRLDDRIESLDGDVVADPPSPDDDLIDGTITLRDRGGALVGVYRVNAGDVQAALDQVDLSLIERPE